MALLLDHDYTAAAVVFLLAASTDFLDGRLARRWGVTSELGSFLDTTADKLLVTTGLMALVIIGREFAILGLRAAVSSGGRHFATSALGKWKATAQFAALALAMLRPPVTIGGAYLDQWALVAAAAITAWSGIDYFARSATVLRS